jgi:hypothetical protein
MNDPDFIRYVCDQIDDTEWLTELIRRSGLRPAFGVFCLIGADVR